MPLPPPAPLAPSCTPPQAPYAAWQQLGLSGAWCSWVLQARIRALGNPRELLLAPQPHPQEEGAWQYPITPPPFPLSPGSRGNLFHAGSRWARGRFDFQAGAGGACLSWGTRPVTTACSGERSTSGPGEPAHSWAHADVCQRGKLKLGAFKGKPFWNEATQSEGCHYPLIPLNVLKTQVFGGQNNYKEYFRSCA